MHLKSRTHLAMKADLEQALEALYLEGGSQAQPVFREQLAAIVEMQLEVTLRMDRKTQGGKALKDGIEIRFGEAKPTDKVRQLIA